jgi:hypothetical protein
MSKKPYSEYDCPVCQKKDIQQGSFGKHLAKHTVAELLKFVKNIEAVKTDGAHPEIHVNGAVFAVCHDTQYGYQKGLVKPLTNEKKHGQECKLLYHNWATASDLNPPQNLITVEIPIATQPVATQPVATQPVATQPIATQPVATQPVATQPVATQPVATQPVATQPVAVHPVATQPEVVEMPVIEQPVVPVQNAVALVQNAVALLLECSNKTKCMCHLEITRLKEKILEQDRELELFRQWRQMIVSSAPPLQRPDEQQQAHEQQAHEQQAPETRHDVPEQTAAVPQQTAAVPEVQAVTPPPVPKKRVQISEPKQAKAKPTIKASKKEKEKGMWCETCESCKQTAQFATDLRPCGRCAKKCHYNDDLVGCYHFDCEICDTKICLPCVKAAGAQSNKMHPMCSPECYKKYMASR